MSFVKEFWTVPMGNVNLSVRRLCRGHNIHQAVKALGPVMKTYVPSLR